MYYYLQVAAVRIGMGVRLPGGRVLHALLLVFQVESQQASHFYSRVSFPFYKMWYSICLLIFIMKKFEFLY